MGDYAYGIMFSDAATAYMDQIGIDASYRELTGDTLYTLDSRIGFRKECHQGELLTVELSLLGADRKRLHIFMRLLNAKQVEVALCEQLLIYVSRGSGKPCAIDMPESINEKVQAHVELTNITVLPLDWLDRKIGLHK